MLSRLKSDIQKDILLAFKLKNVFQLALYSLELHEETVLLQIISDITNGKADYDIAVYNDDVIKPMFKPSATTEHK